MIDFSQIALLLVVAATFGIVAKSTKQPLLVGYLFAGIFLIASGLITDSESISSLGQIGVALLLFLLGIEMNIHELPSIGKVALATGLGQIIFTFSIGFLLSSLLGFSGLSAVYIAIGLTFSSTIIMVKLLSEKKDLSSLYGKISVGFLLVQDFVAVLILVFLSSIGKEGRGNLEYLIVFFKILFLVLLTYFLSKKVLPYLFEKIVAPSNELLFIVSVSWALGVAAFVSGPMGFSLEIGGFLAGISLSGLSEHLQIASRLKPLRDFFLTIFFIFLGTQLVFGGNIVSILPKAVILSLFVLVGNPLIILTILGIFGYKKRTSFMAGLTVAQISEFSLVIITMGSKVGHVDSSDVAVLVLVGVITMTISTYMILGSEKIFKKISPFLKIFERKNIKEKAFIKEQEVKDHIVLVGCHRSGQALLPYLVKNKTGLVVVDFNPFVFNKLTSQNIQTIFGDITDPDIFEAAKVEDSKIVISTISNYEDNLTLLEEINLLKQKPITIFTTNMKSEALRLYEKGAGYVVVPEIVAGDHIKTILRLYKKNHSNLNKAGRLHFDRLLFTT